MTNKLHLRRKRCAQRGYAMLTIITILAIAATTLVVTSLNSTAIRSEQDRKTIAALALAKLALIGRAAADDDRPGSLPCPDTDNDGQSNIANPVTGDCVATVGRLPWQTLGLPDLRDASGERLWYALAQQFSDVTGNVINSNTPGALNVTGTLAASNAAAIVFAPGAPLATQVRDASQVNAVAQYVESYVSATAYSTSATGSGYNDQLMVITPADIFAVVERRIAREVQNALQTYFTANAGKLPWYAPACSGSGAVNCPTVSPLPSPPSPAEALPAAGTPGYIPTDDPSLNLALPGWFSANGWNAMLTYRVDSDCAAGQPTCGAAFAGYAAGGSGALIGFTGGTANTGTRAVLSFSGVDPMYANYQTTVLVAALQ